MSISAPARPTTTALPYRSGAPLNDHQRRLMLAHHYAIPDDRVHERAAHPRMRPPLTIQTWPPAQVDEAAIAEWVRDVDTLSDDEHARNDLIRQAWESLPAVVAARRATHSPGHRYEGQHRWLAHVSDRLTARPDARRGHDGKAISVAALLRIATALATETRRSGLMMAGHDAVRVRTGYSSATYFLAIDALTRLGVIERRYQGGLLSYAEAALWREAGSPKSKSRSVWQLTQPIDRQQIPHLTWRSMKSESPVRNTYRDISILTISTKDTVDNPTTRTHRTQFYTDLRSAAPAARGNAPSALPPTKRVRAWRRLDPRAVALHKQLQEVSAVWRASRLGTMYPHLLKYAQIDAHAADIVAALNEHRGYAACRTPRALHDVDRFLIAALQRIIVADVQWHQATQ